MVHRINSYLVKKNIPETCIVASEKDSKERKFGPMEGTIILMLIAFIVGLILGVLLARPRIF